MPKQVNTVSHMGQYFIPLLRSHQVVEVEFVLVHDLELAEVTLLGPGVLGLGVAPQVGDELPARVADSADGILLRGGLRLLLGL